MRLVAITDISGSIISQQRYLPFGQVRSDVGSITQTDLGYTGQRALDAGMGGLMDYHARFYDSYLNHFTQSDSLIPGPANPQAWNRFAYVGNNPINFSDPTGHIGCSGANWDDGPNCLNNPNSTLSVEVAKAKDNGNNKDKQIPIPRDTISLTEEYGFCFTIGIATECSGGDSYWKDWWIPIYSPVLRRDLGELANANPFAGFGIATNDYWSGTNTSPKIGFGLDVIKQLLEDAPRNDLTWDQRLNRAGLSGTEGLGISRVSATVAIKASDAVLSPSISLALETDQPWIPIVAVAVTWVATYFAVNTTLTYVAAKTNTVVFPDLGY